MTPRSTKHRVGAYLGTTQNSPLLSPKSDNEL